MKQVSKPYKCLGSGVWGRGKLCKGPGAGPRHVRGRVRRPVWLEQSWGEGGMEGRGEDGTGHAGLGDPREDLGFCPRVVGALEGCEQGREGPDSGAPGCLLVASAGRMAWGQGLGWRPGERKGCPSVHPSVSQSTNISRYLLRAGHPLTLNSLGLAAPCLLPGSWEAMSQGRSWPSLALSPSPGYF